MMNPFILRLVLTVLYLQLTKNFPLIVPLVIFTLIDFYVDNTENDPLYQPKDKVTDLIAYAIFMSIFKNRINLHVLIPLFIWRTIGVISFYKSQKGETLRVFVDGINSTLLVFALSEMIPFVKSNENAFIFGGILYKIIHEDIMHGYLI